MFSFRIDLQLILDAVGALKNGVTAGCFQIKINDKRWIFRIFEWLVNMRARRWFVMDGDLGLFVNRRDFLALVLCKRLVWELSPFKLSKS